MVDVNGKPTRIYRTSPYIMLVVGKGEIELRYKAILVDYLGIILSIIGLVLTLIILLNKKHIPNKKI